MFPLRRHGDGLAIVYGKQRPAMSVSYEPGSFYLVFNADADLENDSTDGAEPVCLHCLIEDGDEQLAAGLDMAKVRGQADWDPDAAEWFVPEGDSHWGNQPSVISSGR